MNNGKNVHAFRSSENLILGRILINDDTVEQLCCTMSAIHELHWNVGEYVGDETLALIVTNIFRELVVT